MSAVRSYSVREAAPLVGYSRQQTNVYVRTGALTSFPDPDTGHARVTPGAIREFLANPPPGARPGRRNGDRTINGITALAARVAALEATSEDLDTLAGRVTLLETDTAVRPDSSPGAAADDVSSDAASADLWRRRANSARDAAAAIAAVGGLYESALDLLRQARRLERQADDKRDEADFALDGARQAWRAAVTAFTTPDDPGEFDPPRGDQPI